MIGLSGEVKVTTGELQVGPYPVAQIVGVIVMVPFMGSEVLLVTKMKTDP